MTYYSAASKRLVQEYKSILKENSPFFTARPVEDDILHWHFTIRGAPDSPYENGIYHGKILFPPKYPMKPPTILMLNESGRFEIHTRICLSISDFHPDTWHPSWTIRTMLLALIGHFPTENFGIGAIKCTEEIRKRLAKESQLWQCKSCGVMKNLLPIPKPHQFPQISPENASKDAPKLFFHAPPKPSTSKDTSDTSDTGLSTKNPQENVDQIHSDQDDLDETSPAVKVPNNNSVSLKDPIVQNPSSEPFTLTDSDQIQKYTKWEKFYSQPLEKRIEAFIPKNPNAHLPIRQQIQLLLDNQGQNGPVRRINVDFYGIIMILFALLVLVLFLDDE